MMRSTRYKKKWLKSGLWFSQGALFSSTNKIDRHDKTEILLKVVLNTITLLPTHPPQSICTNLPCYGMYNYGSYGSKECWYTIKTYTPIYYSYKHDGLDQYQRYFTGHLCEVICWQSVPTCWPLLIYHHSFRRNCKKKTVAQTSIKFKSFQLNNKCKLNYVHCK